MADVTQSQKELPIILELEDIMGSKRDMTKPLQTQQIIGEDVMMVLIKQGLTKIADQKTRQLERMRQASDSMTGTRRALSAHK